MRFWKVTLLLGIIGLVFFSGCIKKPFSLKLKSGQKQADSSQIPAIQPFTYEFSGFNYKSWDLEPLMSQIMAVQTELTQKIRLVNKESGTVKVYGYADRRGPEDPVGSKIGNIALSLKRANSVVNYLSSRFGVSADMFKVIGLGSSELKNNDSPYDKVNRRVVVEYSK